MPTSVLREKALDASALSTPCDKNFFIWVLSILAEGSHLRRRFHSDFFKGLYFQLIRHGDEGEGLAEVLENNGNMTIFQGSKGIFKGIFGINFRQIIFSCCGEQEISLLLKGTLRKRLGNNGL